MNKKGELDLKYILILAILCIIVLFLLSSFLNSLNSVGGDIPLNENKVSLTDMRYEVMYDTDIEKGNNDRDDLYELTDDNVSYNMLNNYYDMDNGNNDYLLVDRNIFNFTDYDKFYIEFYNPLDNDIFIEFKYSYEFGNTTNKYCNRFTKDEILNRYTDQPFYYQSSLSQIALYYSKDAFYPMYDSLFNDNSLLVLDRLNYYYRDADYNISLNNPDENTFEIEYIDIKNNFDTFYSQLNYYNEIWITGINQLYIKDFGFIKYGDLEESYSVDGRVYNMLYGTNQYHLYVNLTDNNITTGEYVYNEITIGCYDSDTINHINFATIYDNFQYMTYYIFNHDGAALFSTKKMYNERYWHAGNPNYRLYYIHCGMNLFLNQNSIVCEVKEWVNSIYYEQLFNGMETNKIQFLDNKVYYGYQYVSDNYTITQSKISVDIETLDNDFHNDDAIYIIDTSYEKPKQLNLKIKGDWEYFDSLRNGFNAILLGIGGILYLIIDALDLITIPIDNINTNISGIIPNINSIDSGITSIGLDLSVVSSQFTSLFNGVNANLGILDVSINGVSSQFSSMFDTVNLNLGILDTTLTGINNSITSMSSLLNGSLSNIFNYMDISLTSYMDAIIGFLDISPWLIDLYNYIVGGWTELSAFSLAMFGMLWDFLLFIPEMSMITLDFFTASLRIYLYCVIIISMIRILGNVNDENTDLGVIFKDTIYWMVFPIIIIYKFVKWVVSIIGNFMPFT